MMNSINLMGRFVKDPESSTLQSGTAKAVFCLAVDRDTKPQNADKYGTDFINCIAWGKKAEFVSKYFKKGKLCGITGRLEINNYTDQGGNKKSYTQVNVSSIYFGGPKGAGSGLQEDTAPAEPAMMQSEFAVLEDDDSDLPF